MSKPTPGPWINMGSEVCGPVNSGVIVARIPEWGAAADGSDPRLANARLIASAPDLLEALERLLMSGDVRDAGEPGALKQARAAIAKATGSAS